MTTQRAAHLLDHEYDGIQEYDNPTPGWWHLIFLGSVLISIIYYAFWQFSPAAWTIEDSWQAHQVAEYRRIFGAVGNLAGDEDTIQRLRHDQQLLAVAQGIFRSNCAACHAGDGGGINGVNLTDDSYKNVKRIGDLFSVITNGANNGAMPKWEQRLSTNERVILASYVANLRGTKPAAPKAPEGEVIPPWPLDNAK